MRNGRIARTAALFAGFMASALPAAADPQQPPSRPVVVELFTSQGCSSCPPADALLRELSRRDDVLALGFHISYWDRLGWKDPLSSEASTERQRSYARRLNGGQIYTPQIVVEGSGDMVGSDRAAVLAELDVARPVAAAAVIFAPDRHSVRIGAGTGNASVLLVRFIRHQTTEVAAGENAGRILQDANGVRTFTTLGDWTGPARDFPIEPPAAGEGLAVLVQTPDGRILGTGVVNGDNL
jgi:hypothetical protein